MANAEATYPVIHPDDVRASHSTGLKVRTMSIVQRSLSLVWTPAEFLKSGDTIWLEAERAEVLSVERPPYLRERENAHVYVNLCFPDAPSNSRYGTRIIGDQYLLQVEQPPVFDEPGDFKPTLVGDLNENDIVKGEALGRMVGLDEYDGDEDATRDVVLALTANSDGTFELWLHRGGRVNCHPRVTVLAMQGLPSSGSPEPSASSARVGQFRADEVRKDDILDAARLKDGRQAGAYQLLVRSARTIILGDGKLEVELKVIDLQDGCHDIIWYPADTLLWLGGVA